MKELSLSNRILNYLKKNPETWVSGGELEAKAMAIGRKASNASRRCRELYEDGKIERDEKSLNGGVKHVYYRYVPKETIVTKTIIVEEDGRRFGKVVEEKILI